MSDYEIAVGIEIHAELATETKIFCSCPTTFGAEPNTLVCPVCTGLPGALPSLNRHAVELAVRAGLALGCEISQVSRLDRKNYFYPDLPKAYQISQYDRPLCRNGALEIDVNGSKRRVGITRIHIEEDAGKLLHSDLGTQIDCNRCGVPLIEIVTEPDLRSSEEAVVFLKELRQILLYTGVSDCRMNEGSLRFDVNLSVHKPGEPLGTRTETKNINSFAFVKEAIEYESKRQIALLEAGGSVECETRRYDVPSGKTYAMRKKESQDDYRFFPEPNLPPFVVTPDEISRIKRELPELPSARRRRYVSLGLSQKDAVQLTEKPSNSDFFDRASRLTSEPKLLANLMLGELFSLLEPEFDGELPISEASLARIATLSGEGVVNSSTAKKLVRLVVESGKTPDELVESLGLAQIRDPERLAAVVDDVLAANSKAVETLRSGKKSARGALMGALMAATEGRGDPAILSRLLDEKLATLN